MSDIEILLMRIQEMALKRKELEQQLAEKNALLTRVGVEYEQRMGQLAAALAAIKLKDEALQQLVDDMGDDFSVWASSKRRAIITLSVQPDDSALKAWLGEPEWFYRKDVHGVNCFYEDIEERPKGCIPLYSPKGTK